jgi:hypothetical protein
MKLTTKLYTILDETTTVVLIAIVLVCIFGWVTDCPNTAGYVYCAVGK